MDRGKLMVVTRFVATGTVTTTRTSRVTRWMASGVSANTAVAVSKSIRLIGDFIFEVADSGGKATVGSHIRIADEAQAQFEVERFVKHLLLKNAGANDLAGDGGENFIIPCREESIFPISAFW